MSFPSNCFKGIPNNTYLNTDGKSVGTHLFYFDKKFSREGGFIEQSINWEDNESALEFTLRQRKTEGEIQFRGGVARISRSEIDRLNHRPAVKDLLSYERQPLPDNNYHGNLLLRSNTSKPTIRLVAAGLALAVSQVLCNPQ